MPFKDIACHVWAIDGYVDDPTAARVNLLFIESANSLRNVANNLEARTMALNTIITHTRQSALTEQEAIVYGGFRKNQNAPEHMWLEYNNKIYETMPGYDLTVDNATRARRLLPRLENLEFPEGGVVAIRTRLTVHQKRYLDSQR